MGIPVGTHTFGPENGALWVRTGRTGAVAQAGHDLLIQVTSWQATLEVADDPAQTSLVLEADSTSLRVQDGFGGMQPLAEDDKANIEQTIDDEVLKQTDIEFRSTAVQAAEDGGRLIVEGDLTLVGTVHPLELDVVVGDDGRLSGSAVIRQSDWGMTPYTALFGALKVADEVSVAVDATWRESVSQVAAPPDWAEVFEIEWRPVPVVDPGVSSFVWALVFFLFLWFGMVAVDVTHGTALPLALVTSFFLFLYFRTRGMGRLDDE